MFATGIENSIPTIQGGKVRVDEMESCGHYKHWKTDFDICEDLGIRYLRYGPPLHTSWLGLGVTEGATEVLKMIVRERRPDGSDYRSFPSGHTSLSFAAAGYLQKRYGWQWGLPATAVAALVGFSRVESKSHHWYDVVAGAALGEASAYFLTTAENPNVHWLPWAGGGGGGIMMTASF